MKHDAIYSHLNGMEFLLVHKKAQWKELLTAIEKIDANQFLKYSNDKTKKGEILYSQTDINNEFKRLLGKKGWNERKTQYYVSGDIDTAKQIVREKDIRVQKETIENRGFEALPTNNQVDFVKDRIAVEVQFGKYFSVAYDLHVKHTFFYSMDDIDVGIEIIPTHEFMKRMDTGVSWYENEITNVIREGRSNPSVPIVMIGIEPENLIPEPHFASLKKAVEKLKSVATERRKTADEAAAIAVEKKSPSSVNKAKKLSQLADEAEQKWRDVNTVLAKESVFQEKAKEIIQRLKKKKAESGSKEDD